MMLEEPRDVDAAWRVVTPRDAGPPQVRLTAREDLDALLADGGMHVVIDLSHLDRVGLPLLAFLVAAHRRAAEAGGRIAVVYGTPAALRAFYVTGLHRVIALYDDLESALAAPVSPTTRGS